jgi:hypothetical protein
MPIPFKVSRKRRLICERIPCANEILDMEGRQGDGECAYNYSAGYYNSTMAPIDRVDTSNSFGRSWL